MTSNHWSALRWAILLPFALGLAAEGLAQDHCWIKYSYDAAGNRISRKWWCGDPTKVEEEEESKSRRVEDFGFRLMPVPARSELTLTSQHDLAGAELEVFTLQGRSVLIQRASGSSAVLDVAALSAGIYVLHIRNGLSEYVTQFNVVH